MLMKNRSRRVSPVRAIAMARSICRYICLIGSVVFVVRSTAALNYGEAKVDEDKHGGNMLFVKPGGSPEVLTTCGVPSAAKF